MLKKYLLPHNVIQYLKPSNKILIVIKQNVFKRNSLKDICALCSL